MGLGIESRWCSGEIDGPLEYYVSRNTWFLQKCSFKYAFCSTKEHGIKIKDICDRESKQPTRFEHIGGNDSSLKKI